MLGDPEDLTTYFILEIRMPSFLPLVCQNSVLSYINSADSKLSSLAARR